MKRELTILGILALFLTGVLVLAQCSKDEDGEEDDTTTDLDVTPDISDTVSDLTDTIPDPTTEPPPDVVTDDAAPDGDCTAMGTTGEACAADGDCCGVPVGGECVTSLVSGYITFPGGYCSSTTCESNEDCGAGAECVDAYIMTVCLLTCTDSSDCRESEEYECAELPIIGGGPYCLPVFEMPDMPPDGVTDVYPDLPPDTIADIPVDTGEVG